MARREHILEATTGAISWTIFEGDMFNVPRVDLVFASAPLSAGSVTITKDAAAGAAYDTVVRAESPVGVTQLHFEGLHGFVFGDKIVVAYDNPDSISILGTASVELPNHVEEISAAGMTWDNGTIRSQTATYAHYYHPSIASTNPGASGATWIPADANQCQGQLLNAAGEKLEMAADIHDDWDMAYDPELEVKFTIQTDNTGGADADAIDLQLVCTYIGNGESSVRTQTIAKSVVIGKCSPYTRFNTHIDIDKDYASNNLQQGDIISLVLSVPATGDLTAAVINDVSFYYPTTHVGQELAFV